MLSLVRVESVTLRQTCSDTDLLQNQVYITEYIVRLDRICLFKIDIAINRVILILTTTKTPKNLGMSLICDVLCLKIPFLMTSI